ncbi:MAG: 50S ribosomal protein L29 [Candidatus Aerophobetes bacterium]|nr:50S ribosomal protein L29 [Candidatus Aerophobetes bacterium]
MKLNELLNLSKRDLYQRLKDFKAELFSLRVQAAQGRTTDSSRVKKVKKTIARIKTLLREKET